MDREPDADLVLQALHIKGRATREVIEAVLGAGTAAAIEPLEADGLIAVTKVGYKVTDAGRSRAEELYAAERQQAGAVGDDVYEAFLPINDDLKQIVTDWQCRIIDGEVVLNEHNDQAHDDAVIARLRATDAAITAALAPLSAALPRFDAYARRLQRALASIDAGDHSMVAAPIKDSYHTVWFELHEELLLLTGRPRTE